MAHYLPALLKLLLSFIYLDFSNILSKVAIERLAEVDEYEVVREVQVCAIIHFLNTLPILA